MNMPTHLLRNNQQGLTLIEILVAMTISLLLLAGVVQIFASSKASYRINEAQSRLQENGRFALQMMTKDIRVAGFWGCLSDNTLGDNTLGDNTQVVNNLNLPNGSIDPALGGLNGTEGGAGIPPPPDSITLQGAVGDGLPVNTLNRAASVVTSVVTSVNNGLVQGDFLLMGSCTRANLLQVTNANPSTSGSIVFNTGAGTPGNAFGPPDSYSTNAVLYRASSVAYTIANGNSGQPSLFRSVNGGAPMELVEGVENLQILYGDDTDADTNGDNGDGTANVYGTANIVNMNSVVSVRVNLTLRSLADNISLVAGPVDRRLRRTFSSTIVLRNRVR